MHTKQTTLSNIVTTISILCILYYRSFYRLFSFFSSSIGFAQNIKEGNEILTGKSVIGFAGKYEWLLISNLLEKSFFTESPCIGTALLLEQ